MTNDQAIPNNRKVWTLVIGSWSKVLLSRPQQPLGLVQRLLIFALRVRVCDDAAADGELHPAAAGGECADEDVRVHRTVEADVTERAAIRPASCRLKLGDDLH